MVLGFGIGGPSQTIDISGCVAEVTATDSRS